MLIRFKGNIWNYQSSHWIVIPTNIGWRANGENVMGTGLAKQAKSKFPEVAAWYGVFCRSLKEEAGVIAYRPGKLIMFPVKPLNKNSPNLSWQNDADLELIEKSAIQLADLQKTLAVDVAVPLVGCGAGRLNEADVIPILDKHLKGRFILVMDK
jgi:hypothetical protein